ACFILGLLKTNELGSTAKIDDVSGRTSCRTCSRLISGAKRCVATSSYRCVDRESKEFEFVTEEIIEEGIVDQISR
ncbi:hypothetical protein Tco_1440807, partial [Tanacetum coccineum]